VEQQQQQQQQQLCLLLPGASAVAEAVAERIWHPMCIQLFARLFLARLSGVQMLRCSKVFSRLFAPQHAVQLKGSGLGCGWLRGRGLPYFSRGSSCCLFSRPRPCTATAMEVIGISPK